MENCIFCKIIKGDIPSYTIYEDDIVKVFLDVNPMSPGHMLIIPKKHFENLDDIDIAEFKEIPTYKRMCICILRNDHVCKYMGFALTKEETLMKNMALKQYGKIFKDE